MSNTENKYSIQQAADHLIRLNNGPMSSKEIVKKAMRQNMLRESKASNPSYSFAQTLERNIRMDMGNNPPLKFVYGKSGERLIDVAGDATGVVGSVKSKVREIENLPISIRAEFDTELIQNLRLYMIANQITEEAEAIPLLVRMALREQKEDMLNKIADLTKKF